MSDGSQNQASPTWSSTTKLVVGLSFVAILAGLLVRFQEFIGPLLLAFIVSYLLYPLIDKIRSNIKISWRFSVTIIYLLIIVSILGLATWGGFTLIEQGTSLVKFLNTAVADIPGFLNDLSQKDIVFGTYTFKLDTIINQSMGTQLLNYIQPALGKVGTILTGLASGAASFFAWMFFILLVSYFIVSETGGFPDRIINIKIPGYQVDVERITSELSRIWNAFLRGQMIIIAITIVVYAIYLGGMQVNYFIGLAVLAGLARFVPYVGPAVAWTTYGLVSLFQTNHLFGLNPWLYVLLIVGGAMLIDAIMDNLVVPRLLADALQVHPAAVMLGALIGISILGVVGVVLAAPVVASIKLFLEYASNKMMDMDPWENLKTAPPPEPIPPVLDKVKSILQASFSWIAGKITRLFNKSK